MKIIVIILSISTLYSAELFKGYIKIERHKWLFAEGEYENGGMNGKWSFYADSTKSIKVASGNYISGNKTRISKTGIPEDGRDGLWKHYYNTRYNDRLMKNQLKATQYWSGGKLNGEFTSYFKDGKIAVESTYQDGKQHGIRKEWYMNGFMYTNLFRETEYVHGKPIKDNLYNLDSNIYMRSTYNDSSRIDSIYEYNSKSLLIVTEVIRNQLHGEHKLYHKNGNIWQEGRLDKGLPDGVWKEYSDNGTLISKVRFNKGIAVISDNEKQEINDVDGNTIYSYTYINDKRNGEAIELLHNVPNIKHSLELNKMSHHKRCRFISYFNDYNKEYSTQRINENKSRDRMSWNNGFANYVISLNKFQPCQYRLEWSEFKGIHRRDNRDHMMPINKILGKGEYKNNIRIGEWSWHELETNKLVLNGEYNKEGIPIGVWQESDPRDKNNIIITKYSDDGKVISISKKTITYSSK